MLIGILIPGGWRLQGDSLAWAVYKGRSDGPFGESWRSEKYFVRHFEDGRM